MNQPFSADEVFTLLANVTRKQDVIEISQYCAANVRHYRLLDNSLFLQALNIYVQVFEKIEE